MEKTDEPDKTKDSDNLLKMYLDTLSKKEYASYMIAKSHLGTSFQLEKSIGFLQWIATSVLRSKTVVKRVEQ